MVEKREGNQVVNFLLLLLVLASFFVLLSRSFELMVIKGSWFRTLAQENRLRRVKLSPLRGEIVDRQGRKLAVNKVTYCSEDNLATAEKTKDEGQCSIVSRDKALQLKAADKLVESRFLRFYPLGSRAAHLTGYLGEVGRGEKLNCPGFKAEDYTSLVGRGGVEEFYDCHLRGKNGWRLIEVNANGRVLRELGSRPAQHGQKLRLTIDGWLQDRVAKAMGEKKGAVVALDPQSGQVLALYSSPSFDPNKFTFERNDKLIRAWLGDREGLPLVNRAISGSYHPGSVFKPVVAIAGLESGKITGQTLVEDVGVIKIGQWKYSNWYWTQYGRKDGMVDLAKAIKRSNDIYFYKLGEWTGVEAIVDWASRFGLGKPLGLDLPAEVGGILPSPSWKEKAKGEKWFLGDTYHLAIGQGSLTTTPLQVTSMMAAFANGGRVCQPHLMMEDDATSLTTKCYDLGIKKANLELIRKGLAEACLPKGTGFPFFKFTPRVGCKTGTAEIGDGTQDSHAWFTVFAPWENPKIVLTVFLERGGSGSWQAAPIAKEILGDYFKINQ